jgi:hypothetical protein
MTGSGMTWHWWLFAIAAGVALEILARTRYGMWADRIATTVLFIAAAVIIARRVRES